MTISRPLPRATNEAETFAPSPPWKRLLATLASLAVPGTGLVWADRYAAAWRWWLVNSFGLLPVLVLVNLAPGHGVVVAWTYILVLLALLAAQLRATWLASRKVHTWRGKRAALFAVVAYLVAASGNFAAKQWLAEQYRTPGNAMAPSLVVGDRFFVPRLRRDLALQRGAVVVYRNPRGVSLVGRVVGLPGDVVEVGTNGLSVNGLPVASGGCPDLTIDEFYPPTAPKRWTKVEPCLKESLEGRRWRVANSPSPPEFHGRWNVESGRVFIVGDWRANSLDSRSDGALPQEDVLGPVLAVWMSIPPDGWWPRWERIGVEP